MSDTNEKLLNWLTIPLIAGANANEPALLGIRSAILARMSDGWQPIETAPEDDRVIIFRGNRNGRIAPLVYAAKRATTIKNLDGGPTYCRDNDGFGFTVSAAPTHWMADPDYQLVVSELNQ
jgi:hypothetical protein